VNASFGYFHFHGSPTVVFIEAFTPILVAGSRMSRGVADI
jgi:hypothetical protein